MTGSKPNWRIINALKNSPPDETEKTAPLIPSSQKARVCSASRHA